MGNKINGVRERMERACIDEHGITRGTHTENGEIVATLFCIHCREVFGRDMTTAEAREMKQDMIESGAHACPKAVQS